MPETCERPRRLHPLTRLETHWGHFSPGLHNIAWQGDGYLVDPIALCGAFMNVAFEWRWASRHPDSLYLYSLYVGNGPDVTSKATKMLLCHLSPPLKPLFFWVTRRESPLICCFPFMLHMGWLGSNSCFYFGWSLSLRETEIELNLSWSCHLFYWAKILLKILGI